MAKATKTKGFEKFISILRSILSLAPEAPPVKPPMQPRGPSQPIRGVAVGDN